MTDTTSIAERTTPVVGVRARFGVVVPATNAVVEHDYQLMAPEGVTCHTGRMYLPDPVMDSDEDFVALLEQIRASIRAGIDDRVPGVGRILRDH